MLNNIIIGMCGVNLTSFGCEEKILSKEHIVQWSKAEPYGALWSYVEQLAALLSNLEFHGDT